MPLNLANVSAAATAISESSRALPSPLLDGEVGAPPQAASMRVAATAAAVRVATDERIDGLLRGKDGQGPGTACTVVTQLTVVWCDGPTIHMLIGTRLATSRYLSVTCATV